MIHRIISNIRKSISYFFKSLFSEKMIASKCGHKTKLFGKTGHGSWLGLPLEEDGAPLYCIKCLEGQAVKCIHCEELIYVGEQIQLMTIVSTDKDEGLFQKLEVVVSGKKVGEAYPVCENCTEYMLISAHLHPDHKADYFGSTLEAMMHGNGSAVLISDTSQIAQTRRLYPLED